MDAQTEPRTERIEMKLRTVLLLVLVLGVVGCSSFRMCKHLEWRHVEGAFVDTVEWEYVCTENGYIAAVVAKDITGPNWHVWANGAGYGEYVSFEEAKKQAEHILRFRFQRSR